MKTNLPIGNSYFFKFLFVLVFLLGFGWGKGQTVIYSENFEGFSGSGFLGTTAVGGWTADVNYVCNNQNYWSVYNTGSYTITNKSLMISGLATGCSVLAGSYYVGTTQQRTVYTTVNAIGYDNLILDFDWRCYGERSTAGNNYDYGEVVYRIGTSGAWVPISTGGYSNGIYVLTNSVTHSKVVLPSTLAGVTFQLGFSWRNDNSGGGAPAFVVDNISLSGTAVCGSIVAAASKYLVCPGEPTTLSASSVSSGYTYSWYTNWDNATRSGTLVGTGASITVNPTESTLYGVVATKPGCPTGSNATYQLVSIAVTPTPELVVLDPTEAITCNTDFRQINVVSGGAINNTVFDENFDPVKYPWISYASPGGGSSATAHWAIYQGNFFPGISRPSSYVMVNSDAHGPYDLESSLVSPPISLVNHDGPVTLSFSHFFRQYLSASTGYVEVTTNGSTWTTLQSYTSTQGSGTGFQARTINLNAYVGAPFLQIRFRYTANYAYYWAIDDIKIVGVAKSSTVTWLPIMGLYMDAAGTVPYVLNQHATTVYASPSVTTTYTASAKTATGCPANTTVTIERGDKSWNASTGNWNTASTWNPVGVPTQDHCVRIASGRAVSVNSLNAVAKRITIEPGGRLEVAGALTVEENVVNQNTGATAADQFVVLSDGNYIQKSTIANTVAGGVIRVDRAVIDMDNMPNQLDYVYWGSPVAGQNIREFSPGTPWNRRFQYNEATDYFVPATEANFVPGKGYAIEAETNSNGSHLPNPTGYGETYKFRGVPNNGDISMPIQRTNAGTTGAGLGYNLVGNPYPSNIKFEELYSGNSALIFNTAWFWTNNNFTAAQQGSGYEGNNYAVYNGTGGAPATANGSGNYPTGIVKAGQGFMIQKKATGSGNLVFKNSYGAGKDLRVTTPGTFFQRGASSTKDRFWLEMVSPAGMYNTQLIGYIDGATDGYEQDYDAEAFGMSADLFYSLLVDKKLVINGKSHNFNVEDTVPLGANIFNSGEYRIQLRDPEGRFANGQSIYIKDKVSGLLTNLSEGSYTFLANKGVTEGRFEIIYKPETILTVDNSVKDGNLIVYRDGEDFAVHSTSKAIDFVEVYDMSGRLYKTIKGGDKIVRFSAQNMASGTYILKIIREGEVSNKRILK